MNFTYQMLEELGSGGSTKSDNGRGAPLSKYSSYFLTGARHWPREYVTKY